MTLCEHTAATPPSDDAAQAYRQTSGYPRRKPMFAGRQEDHYSEVQNGRLADADFDLTFRKRASLQRKPPSTMKPSTEHRASSL